MDRCTDPFALDIRSKLKFQKKPPPNLLAQNGQTALNIANRLGYITVVETLKVVTETNITQVEAANGNGTVANGNGPAAAGGTEPSAAISAPAKYKVIAPESMHETFLSDSEDEGGKCRDFLFFKYFFILVLVLVFCQFIVYAFCGTIFESLPLRSFQYDTRIRLDTLTLYRLFSVALFFALFCDLPILAFYLLSFLFHLNGFCMHNVIQNITSVI